MPKPTIFQPDAAEISTRKSPVRRYTSRSERFRLFLLCGMLMLVLVAMDEARKPATWDWLWAGEDAIETEEEPIDTRVDLPTRDLPPGVFQASAIGAGDVGQPSVSAFEGEFYLGITRELLMPIRDSTVFRAAENEAWSHILQQLQQVDQGELVSSSQAQVGFSQLFRQSQIYRGKIVTVQGTVRRLEELEPSDPVVDRLYRWSLQPQGGSNAPIIVYSVAKPTQLDVGDLSEAMEFTGVYFKKWAYRAGDGTRVAPLILAKLPTWSPVQNVEKNAAPSTSWIASACGLALALAAGIVVAVMYVTNRRDARLQNLRNRQQGIPQGFDGVVTHPPITETLRQLSEEAHDHE